MHPSLQAALRGTAEVRESDLAELARYTERRFDAAVSSPLPYPLADEPLAASWAVWAQEARSLGAAAVLRRVLPQLSFPVRSGMSRAQDYRAATLRGVAPGGLSEATGLPLERPGSIELELYASFAGGIPVVTVRHRADFATLVQALARRNEPASIPPSQGAALVAGLANWERIRSLRAAWEALPAEARETDSWAAEWRRIQERKELYQDRLVLLSDGEYSGVPAAELALSDDEWRRQSLLIRREHECTHYFTRRAYGSMRNHLLDELVADYAGITVAAGTFRADWFLQFLGLDGPRRAAPTRRFDIYQGDPALGPGASGLLERVVAMAAANLEACGHELWQEGRPTVAERALMVQALATLGLDEIAAPEGTALLARAYRVLEGASEF